MKKNLPIYLYSVIIILVGIFLILSKSLTFQTIKYTLGIALVVGAVLGFRLSLTRKRKQVAFFYHEMHASAMLVYGISVLLICNNTEILIYFTSFLFFYYAFSEIIFCNWLFNLKRKVRSRIVIVRLILGLIVGVGVVVILNYSHLEGDLNLESFGLLFIIIGINVLLYVPIMKTKELKDDFE